MAIRIAKQVGNWSDVNTWDDGLTLPTTGDNVYLNGFNITIDQNVTVLSIRNSTTVIGVPLSIIPNMTSNTTPIGVGQAFADQNNANAWLSFRKPETMPNTVGWAANSRPAAIGFLYDTSKIIKRYAWRQNTDTNKRPRDWTFQGSNDGVTWFVLDTVTGSSVTTYYSTVLPNTTPYTYHRINVSVTNGSNQAPTFDYIDMTESSSLANGYNFGGTATVNNNLTITSDFYTGPSAASLFTVPALTPNQVTFIGNAPGTSTGSGTANPAVINATGTGTINYTGNLRATNQNAMGRGIQLASGTTLNFTGDILGSRNSSQLSFTNAVGIACGVGSTVNMVGSITAAETGIWTRGITTTTNAIVNITGDVNGGVGTDPARTCSGVNLGGGTVTIVGNVYAGPNTIGVEGSATNSSQVRITGNLYNWTDGSMAAFTRFLFLQSANMQWNFKKFDLTNNILYTPGVNTGHPAESNVRTGVVYGPTNNLTGTCAVPPAGAVSLGVPVDNTTGTAYLSGNDISNAVWDTQTTNLNTTGSIGERLKNASTVDTTAATVAAYDI
jgi:hypothetical protein